MRQFIIKKTTLIHYFLIYLMILTTRSGLYYLNENVLNYLIIFICFILTCKHPKLRKQNLYIFFGALAVSLELTRRTVGSGFGISYLLGIIAISWITYVAYYFDPDNFNERIIRISAFFAIISLICWVFLMFAPNLLNLITRKDYDLFYGSRGVLLYVYRYTQRIRGDMRNVGIFTEPGIYQILLNSVIYLLLFGEAQLKFSEKKRIRYLILFIVTLLSTQSTTGYIALAAIVLGYYISSKKKNSTSNNKLRSRILMLLFAAVVSLGLNYVIEGQKSILYTAVFSKIMTNSSLDLNASSGYYRVNAILGGWTIFLRNPLGAGDNYDALFAQVSAGHGSGGGLMILLGSCGIITTLIVTAFNIYPAYRRKKSVVAYILYVFLWVNTALAQSMTIYGCLLFLSLIDFSSSRAQSNYSSGDLNEQAISKI